MSKREEFLWVEKYRPRRIADAILPASTKRTLQDFVDQGSVPNLLLTGPPGIGKTTVAKAMLGEIDADHLVINGSLKGNIDTLRNEIHDFASTVSFKGDRKYVILDEADYLNPQSTQPALRNFMEQYSANCGFILTGNYEQKIIPALQSRCSPVAFKFDAAEKKSMAAAFSKRVAWILEEEKVEFDKDAVRNIIWQKVPDWRRILNDLQRYSSNGKIDKGVLSIASVENENIMELMNFVKGKDFTEARGWLARNNDIETSVFYDRVYKTMLPLMNSEGAKAQAIITLAEYQFKEAFVANTEINRVACVASLMTEADWK